MQKFSFRIAKSAGDRPAAMSGADAQTAQVSDWVRELVDSRPDLDRQNGIAYAARELGLPAPRARAFFYRLVPAALAREWVEASRRFDRWLTLETARMELLVEAKRRRLDTGSAGSDGS